MTKPNQLPDTLYHGSHYRHSVLQPGIVHSKEEVFWDETESNRYLYATTDKNAAIVLGFASAIDKVYLLNRFQHDGNRISITLEDKGVSLSDLLKLDVFLYTIKPTESMKWIKNNNEYNDIDTEYKTQESVKYSEIEKIDLKSYVAKFKIDITTQAVSQEQLAPAYLKW